MSDAPDDYNKSYCDAVVKRLEQAVQNAITSGDQSVEVQRTFTKQSLKHINKGLIKAFRDLEKGDKTNKELKNCITKSQEGLNLTLSTHKIETRKECKKTRLTVYGGAIAGILLYVGSQWAIITYLVTLIMKTKGLK